MELGSLWMALTGDRPSPQLDGWAQFLREHIPEITKALGSELEATKRTVLRQQRESEQTLAQIRASWRPTLLQRFSPFFRGPLGWVIAGVLLVAWAVTK
jgi:hypothetical protein